MRGEGLAGHTGAAGRPARRYLGFAAWAVGLAFTVVGLSQVFAGRAAHELPSIPTPECGPALVQAPGRRVPVCVGDGVSVAQALSLSRLEPGCRLLDFDARHPLGPWQSVFLGDREEVCRVSLERMPGEARLALGGRMPLNTASAAELDALPGVGPRAAERMVLAREERGRFTSLEDAGAAAGLGRAGLERLRPLVSLE
jgi:competence ComEA-like helix-hairpin-helix protein